MWSGTPPCAPAPQRALRLQGDLDALRVEMGTLREERDAATQALDSELQEKERRHLQVCVWCVRPLPGCVL
jgi:hypothetical protein